MSNTKDITDNDALRLVCRDSLAGFAETMFEGYKAAPVHELIAQKVEQCFERKIRALIVVAPPRHGKSQICSVAFPAWALTRNPKLQIIQAAYSEGLAGKFAQDTKAVLRSAKYAQLFPQVIDTSLDRQNEFRTLQGGSYLAVGIGSGTTGRGCDVLICDDLLKDRKEADSMTIRNGVWDWLTSTALTRLSPNGVVVITMTRWAPDDPVGRFIAQSKKGDFELLNLPAYAEENDALDRPIGEPLWPERWPRELLERKRGQLLRRDWESLYMGHATPPGGALVDVSRIRYIDAGQLPTDIKLERAWDLAVGTSVNHDYSVGARGGCDVDKNFYLVDVNRGRRSWAAQKPLIAALARSEKGRIGVEAVSAFQIAAEELRAELAGEAAVKPMKVHTSKEIRMTGWASLIESGKFFIVRGPWTEAFVNELADFPGSPHDDQVDAVSLLYELTRKRQQLLVAVCGGDDDEPLGGLHGRRSSSGLGGLSSLHPHPAQRIFR